MARAIHRHRGTITFAPNFAYALAVAKRIAEAARRWDLSCLRALGCGAEPIDAATVRAFMDKFEPAGLKATAILPSYGLAESTLAVTFADLDEPLVTDASIPRPFCAGGRPRRATAMRSEIVSCGRPFPGHRVEVVDESGRSLGERTIGEIVVEGPSVTNGYFGDATATRATFRNGRAPHRRSRLLRRRASLCVRAEQGPHHPARPQLLPSGHREGSSPRWTACVPRR